MTRKRRCAFIPVLILIGLSGCMGYESSPWGATQKANPGLRIQANPATGQIDIGVTSDMDLETKTLDYSKDGTIFKMTGLDARSSASSVRREDVGQLNATENLAKIYTDGFNEGLRTMVPLLGMLAGRADVPADIRDGARDVIWQQLRAAFLRSIPAPPPSVGPPVAPPTSQPVP